MNLNQGHRTLLQCNSTKLGSTANATTTARQSNMKLNDNFAAMMLSINKIAHGVLPKINSVKEAVEKMIPRYATTVESTKLGTVIKTSIPRDISSILILENAEPSYKNGANIKRSFSKRFPSTKLLYAS